MSVNINYKICIKACCKIQLHMSKPNLRLVSGYTLLTYMILLVFHPYFFVFSFLDIKQHFLWVFFNEIWKIMLLFYFSRVVFPKDYKCRLIWWWYFLFQPTTTQPEEDDSKRQLTMAIILLAIILGIPCLAMMFVIYFMYKK